MGILAQDTGAGSSAGSWGLASDGVSTWAALEGNSFLNRSGGELRAHGDTTSTKMSLGSGTSNDQDITVHLSLGATADTLGPIGRIVDLNNFYYLVVGNVANTLSLGKRSGGSYSDISTAAFSYTTGTKYVFRLRMVGTSIQGKAWLEGSAEPGWMITITDSTFTTGKYGIFVNTPGSIDDLFDTITVTDGKIPLTTESRSKFLTRASQTIEGRAKNFIRASQTSPARANFKVRAALLDQARNTFKVRSSQASEARSKYLIRSTQITQARSRFKVFGLYALLTQARASFKNRAVQASRARSKFLIPLGTIRPAFYAAFKVVQKIARASLIKQKINFSRRNRVAQPNSTITSTATFTDATGAAITNLSIVALTITYPDSTSSLVGLGSGVVNAGQGNYTATYNTKGPGTIKEEWRVTASDGVTVADFVDFISVAY